MHSRSHRVSGLLAVLSATVAVAAGALAAPQEARAHATAGVPYHLLNLDFYEYSGCRYSFPRPHAVYGFDRETVYWRPIAATSTASGWQYEYGDWDWAYASPTGMLPPWYTTDGWGNPTPVFGFAVYPLWLKPGLTYWVGQEIHYGSNGHRHTQWLGQTSC
jgi:hypothetical protein